MFYTHCHVPIFIVDLRSDDEECLFLVKRKKRFTQIAPVDLSFQTGG
jgi:hypothetical protein